MGGDIPYEKGKYYSNEYYKVITDGNNNYTCTCFPSVRSTDKTRNYTRVMDRITVQIVNESV